MILLRRFLVCSLFLLIQASSICSADTTYLQPDSVYLGDTTELVIEYDNSIPSLYSLDTSALEAEFEVVDKKSRIFRVVGDDEVVHRIQWRLLLLPRRSGQLNLPILYFGDRSTPPLTLEVAPVPPALQSSHSVFVDLEADTLTPYLGQQTQIEMRLFRNTPVSVGRLLEPQTGDALIHRQLDELSYRVTRNGQDFEVTERGIALFPRSAGELQLTPVSFQGSIDLPADKSRIESTTGIRNILRRSEPLSLQVRDPPAEYSGRFWLPASRIELSQNWNQAGKNLQVGDSLDWTLTIIARGLPAESLPVDLLATESGNLRIYADQPTHKNRFDGRQIIGRLDQRFAVIASKPGEIVLPALSLKWWDVESDSEKRVQLDGRTINVIEAVMPGDTGSLIDRNTFADWWMKQKSRQWSGSRLLLSALLLVVCLFAIKLLPSRIGAILNPALQRRRLEQRLKLSCLSNDAAGTRAALLDWGRARWPGQKISGLNQIDSQVTSSQLAAQLKRLDAALYSQHGDDWRGRELWRLIKALKRPGRTKPRPRDSDLARLYPA